MKKHENTELRMAAITHFERVDAESKRVHAGLRVERTQLLIDVARLHTEASEARSSPKT